MFIAGHASTKAHQHFISDCDSDLYPLPIDKELYKIVDADLVINQEKKIKTTKVSSRRQE